MSVLRLLISMMVGGAIVAIQDKPKSPPAADPISYQEQVAPIIKKYCLPCHSADNDNASELILDTYDSMLEGGKHGSPVVAEKPKESNLYLKLLSEPPFGRQMPRGKGPKPAEEDIKIIYDWILQGAKK